MVVTCWIAINWLNIDEFERTHFSIEHQLDLFVNQLYFRLEELTINSFLTVFLLEIIEVVDLVRINYSKSSTWLFSNFDTLTFLIDSGFVRLCWYQIFGVRLF